MSSSRSNMSSANSSAINQRNAISSNNIIAEMQICQGSKGMYYCVHNVNFDIHFPLQYALDMTKDAVEFCLNCKKYGYINGVFTGFCCGCIDTKYSSNLGLGTGMEDYETQRVDETHTEYTTIWQTYLRGIDLDQIGDDELAQQEQEELVEQQQEQEELVEQQQEAHELVQQELVQEPAQSVEPTVEADQSNDDDEQLALIHSAMMDGKITVRDERMTVRDERITVRDERMTVRDERITVRDRIINTATICGNN